VGGRALGKVENDDRADWREAWVLFPGDVAYVWHGSTHISEVQESLLAAGLIVRTHPIWAKSQMVIGRGHYHLSRGRIMRAPAREATWPADQVERWPIDLLIPYAPASRLASRVHHRAAKRPERRWTSRHTRAEAGRSAEPRLRSTDHPER